MSIVFSRGNSFSMNRCIDFMEEGRFKIQGDGTNSRPRAPMGSQMEIIRVLHNHCNCNRFADWYGPGITSNKKRRS